MSTPTLIAITGGIGSGKSIVSNILRKLGYHVYDCDSRAKHLIDSDTNIHQLLCQQIHPQAVCDGIVNRPLISKIVFSNPDTLARLNQITHTAVLADIHRWIAHHSAEQKLFIETAIPVTSGIYNNVDQIWQIEAPEPIRIQRVQHRSNLTPVQIKARIQSQSADHLPPSTPNLHTLLNDPNHPLLPQIHPLLH